MDLNFGFTAVETKENLERDCGKKLSGTWIEQGGCHGSY